MDGTTVTAAGLPSRLLDQGTVAPPFGACWTGGCGAPLEVVTDSCGLCHVYVWQGEGVAAMSTSSALLATVTGAPVDGDAIGTFALLGHHVGPQTWYRGVCKLEAGERAWLADGRVRITAGVAPLVEPPFTALSARSAIELGRRALGDAVAAALEAYPDAGIELSGGMDCRAILAAVPAARRNGMEALTLGEPWSRDVRVAAELAASCRLDHRVVDTTALADIAPEDALAMLETAARRRDFGRDAAAGAVLDWVEARADQRPRFTGQGGEFFRGEYYAGQDKGAATQERRIARLATWRLFANGSAAPDLFEPGFLADARRDTILGISRTVEGCSTDWHRTLDELYLRVRMQRWAGAEYAAGTVRRVVLAPYMHEPVLEWGRRVDSVDKRRGRALNAVTASLDPALARIALDSGLRPVELADPGVRASAVLAASGARRVAGKVRRRLGGRGRVAVGAAGLAASARARWATLDGALDRVAQTPGLRGQAVREVAAGRRIVDAPTVSFLVALDGALAASERPPS